MNSSIIGMGIVVLLILVGAVYMVWPKDASSPVVELPEAIPQVPWNPEADPVISYTENGYEPREVTVRVGQTVRFMNDHESRETWPASAVHPTHSLYPEKTSVDCLGSAFDACRGLKPGEHWDFTFNSAGEWRFHDHVRPSKTGVVLVQE